MKKIFIILILIITSFFSISESVFSAEEIPEYSELRSIDIGTFNEYRYKITRSFFSLRNGFDLNGTLNIEILDNILRDAEKGYNYLPDNLYNENLYSKLETAINVGKKEPENNGRYNDIIKATQEFLENTKIEKVKGDIIATPEEGNAPITVTLRGRLTDPSGTNIPDYNYNWWVDNGGKKVVIGQGPSINYTLKEEGTFTVFLEAKSNHKNEKGNTDVLPFSSRTIIKVNEKVASVIIYVNSTNLRQEDEIKVTPEEGGYGIVFDATSSTPTGGSTFKSTKWNFGNGIEKEYLGGPKVERIKYINEGDYRVSLELQTNELKKVKREFTISIHKPIATINATKEQGYLEDKFSFSATPSGNDKGLNYNWTIIDIDNDKEIFKKNGELFTYNFTQKGRFNVKLEVTDSYGEKDQDSKIIYINSRAPEAKYVSSIPFKNKPNTIFLDATQSYDPDYTDDGKLEYSWIIDGERVNLNEANSKGSSGYFTFDSIGEHSVQLEVTDPDSIVGVKKGNIKIDSILAVDFSSFPRVIQREGFIRFVAWSPEAEFYEWDFGDGKTSGGRDDKISHTYLRSGIYEVKLLVRDKNNNTNTHKKIVYVGDSDFPYAYISVKKGTNLEASFSPNACGGKGAYIVDRTESVKFDGTESININGENSGLEYTWILGNNQYFTSSSVTNKFDELGCFQMKLTVRSSDNGKTSKSEVWVSVENLKPILSGLDINVADITTDPVIVTVTAQGAKDPDGVIQSYLWYYKSDLDSEPQDFRATNTSKTTFVIPKVSGNYSFVVVMKDNNEEIVNSEDVSGSKYFITLTGDNFNTPLINLSVDDSSILVGEEIVFSAYVKNILGQDISKKAIYSWDFDGDGFYDRETTTPEVAYKYSKGGEYYAKVKVKYKGISNTKSITINAINKLVADFSYISIGDKYIFFNKSQGSSSSIEWSMGDGNVVEGKDHFEYDYKDGLKKHDVILKISEGTKIDRSEKQVVSSIKNRLKVKDNSINFFSEPEVNSSGEIILNSESEKVLLYLGLSSGDFKYYGIDYDISFDSDLNGTKDDDIDNRNDSSYLDGAPQEIKLNRFKEQTIRIILYDQNGTVFDSRDIKIIKEYVDDQEIIVEGVTLSGATQEDIDKIDSLKNLILDIPLENRLKANMYLSKLQEQWFDNTEKTRTIIEFESYIEEIGATNGREMIEILESFLIKDGEDTSQKNITYNALINLIPEDITCEVPEGEITCYSYLTNLLEGIKNSSDLEVNKIDGKEILEILLVYPNMTDKQKLDFKAILSSFIYGGAMNVPDEDRPEDEVEVGTGTVDQNNGENKLTGLFKGIIFWGGIIILFILGAIFLYWLYYKITNGDDEMGFQDFIIDKTTHKEKVEDILEEDILGLQEKDEIVAEVKTDNKVNNATTKTTNTQILAEKDKANEKKIGNTVNNNIQNKNDTNVAKTSDTKKEKAVPSWLSKSFIEKNDDKKDSVSNDTKKETENKPNIDNKSKAPDWLAGSFDDKKSVSKDDTKTDEKKVVDSKKDDKEKVPDRLAGSFDDKKSNSKDDTKTDEKKVVENKNDDKEKMPDRLAGSLDDKKSVSKDNTKVDDKKIDDSKNDEKEKVPDRLAGSLDDKKSNPKDDTKVDDKKIDDSKNDEKEKVPDWLAGSLDDKKSVSKDNTKVDDKKIDDSKNEDKEKVPDWLVGSFDDKKSNSKDEKKDDDKKVVDSKNDEKEKVPDRLAGSLDDKKSVSKDDTKTDEKKVVENKTTKTEKKVKKATPNKKEEKETKKSELWDNGMDIPDWLKDDEKSDNSDKK